MDYRLHHLSDENTLHWRKYRLSLELTLKFLLKISQISLNLDLYKNNNLHFIKIHII